MTKSNKYAPNPNGKSFAERWGDPNAVPTPATTPEPDRAKPKNASPEYPLIGTQREPGLFPIEAMGKTLRPVAEKLAMVQQVPVSLASACILAVASSVVQGYGDVVPPRRAGALVPTNLFILLSAESSERKSSTYKLVQKGLKRWEKELESRYKNEMERYLPRRRFYEKKKAEIEKRAKSQAELEVNLERFRKDNSEPVHPLTPRIIITNATSEALIKRGATCVPSRSMFNDEVSTVLSGYSMREGRAAETIGQYSRWWDAGDIVVELAGEERPSIRGSRLTVFWMGQPLFIRQMLASEVMRLQGFNARFLLVEPPARAGTRAVGDDAPEHDTCELDEWNDLCFKILSENALPIKDKTVNELEPARLTLDAHAQHALSNFEKDLETKQGKNEIYSEHRSAAGKAVEQSLRLAGVLTLIGSEVKGRIITGDVMRDAIALARFFLSENVELSEAALIDGDLVTAQRLYDWIKAKRGRLIYFADLRRNGPRVVRDNEALKTAIGKLIEHGLIKRFDEPQMIDGRLRKKAYKIVF